MIERLTITDYRCFRDVDVPLAPLTVLIGENNTGKSTFLDAVALLETGQKWHGPQAETFQRRGDTATVRITAGTHTWPVARVQMPASGPSMAADGVSDERGVPQLTTENLASYMDSLLRRDRKRFDEVVDAMKRAVPGLEDVLIEVPQPTVRRLRLRLEGGWEIDGNDISVGARIILFFVALAWHPSPPRLLLIEEPENGLHPRRLVEVMEILHGLCDARHSPVAVQVVISTHSPYLLDLADPERDQLLVFSRNADGSCVAKPLARDKVRVFLDEFGLGEVWTNEGEAGLT